MARAEMQIRGATWQTWPGSGTTWEVRRTLGFLGPRVTGVAVAGAVSGCYLTLPCLAMLARERGCWWLARGLLSCHVSGGSSSFLPCRHTRYSETFSQDEIRDGY